MGANQSWTVGLFIVSTLLPRAAGQELSPIELSIVAYDAARVGPKTLHQAESVAATILLTAAIRSRWEAGHLQEVRTLGMEFTAYTRQQCQAGPISAVLRVQILPYAPAGLPPSALGFSLPCARSGVQVTIYADRVANVSKTGGPTFGRTLGYAIAHELGHVLLHSGAHGPDGLMKAIWSKGDWQRAAVSVIPFSPSQARQIAALHERSVGEFVSELAHFNPH